MKGKGKPVSRELLKQRSYKVDLDSRLNRTQVITKTTPLSQSGGYYCADCDCIVKDSINYLDHINGKKREWQGGCCREWVGWCRRPLFLQG